MDEFMRDEKGQNVGFLLSRLAWEPQLLLHHKTVTHGLQDSFI